MRMTALAIALLFVAPLHADYRWIPTDKDDQVALYKDGKQIGNWHYKGKYFRLYDAKADTWGERVTPPKAPPPKSDALAEVNAARASRGLAPFIRDDGLMAAAQAAAEYRAARLIAGHTSNDFSFVPSGTSATAAGCAAWEPSLGWGSCCTYESWTYAGAGIAIGRDGRRYMHIHVR